MWLLLSSFPLQCWNFGSFTEVANSIGRFILVEETTLISSYGKVQRVQVELDMSKGLLVEIEVHWYEGSFIQ